MPELPEVETIRTYLDPALRGRHIRSVVRLDARMVKAVGTWRVTPGELAALLPGAVVSGVHRRGKFLVLVLGASGRLVLRLGMSGQLVLAAPGSGPVPHTHLILHLEGDQELRLSDPRRFGRIGWLPPGAPDLGTILHLGPEPLEAGWDGSGLLARLAGRRAPLKALLLDQRVVAGLGNIYTDEALFRARLAPWRPGGSLEAEEADRLARAVVESLNLSLAHGGTSFSDYVDALGHPGRNQDYLKVYGRAGLPCPECGTPIATRTVGGRTSHFCPACQGGGPGIASREGQHAAVQPVTGQ